jgi:hypothetical protein
MGGPNEDDSVRFCDLKDDKEHQKLALASNDLTIKTCSTTYFQSEGVDYVTVQLLVPSAKRKHFSKSMCCHELFKAAL